MQLRAAVLVHFPKSLSTHKEDDGNRIFLSFIFLPKKKVTNQMLFMSSEMRCLNPTQINCFHCEQN